MPADRVRDYLRENGVSFQTHTHDRAVTAQEVAAAEHESGWHVAKPVLLMVDDELVMVVTSAPVRVDLDRAREALGASKVRLASEAEFASIFNDCDTGAEPIFGNLYDVPVLVDESIVQQVRIRFAAGTHTETIEVSTPDFVRLSKARTASVGEPRA
ncbi:MAG: YbaK/EbsC family protein [Gemmatimonadota bacterium]